MAMLPSVTMKGASRALPTSMPLTAPTNVPVARAASDAQRDGQLRGQPRVHDDRPQHHPRDSHDGAHREVDAAGQDDHELAGCDDADDRGLVDAGS